MPDQFSLLRNNCRVLLVSATVMRAMTTPRHIIRPGKGQESVWDYPRPPRLARFHGLLQVYFNDLEIARSTHAWRVLETSHPPVYYLPPEDVRIAFLQANGQRSFCEWKGEAEYYDLLVSGKTKVSSAWAYPHPSAAFTPIENHFAFYAGRVDACFVDGERVIPQPGGFYGGWITPNILGPFKGSPGSEGW
jgi:uncharacterized protein (DUF427 family)